MPSPIERPTVVVLPRITSFVQGVRYQTDGSTRHGGASASTPCATPCNRLPDFSIKKPERAFDFGDGGSSLCLRDNIFYLSLDTIKLLAIPVAIPRQYPAYTDKLGDVGGG